MDTYSNLFSASIALAGFIAIFLVFRYQTIDTYVDNRKLILRSLLEIQIWNNPHIVLRIQDIGKDSHSQANYDVQFFSKFNNEAVNRFVEDIFKFRKMRTDTVHLGRVSLIIWGVLSLIYLISPYLFSSTSYYATRIWISMGFFAVSMVFTLYFIIVSLYKKSLAQDLLIKPRYRQSFKNRREILQENSIRSNLYKVRYATVYKHLREFVKSNDGIIADAGCGDGVFISEIVCEYPQLVGLDLSIKSLLYIKEQKEIQHVPLIQGDIENLPFNSNELLSVVCIETLEHLMNTEKGLQEIHRVLRPNGVFIMTVPSALNLRNITAVGEHRIKLLSFLRGFMKTLWGIRKGYIMHTWKDGSGVEFPHRVYWMWKIKRIIEDCGFIVQVITNTPLVISSKDTTLMTLIEKIINRVTRNYLGESFVICAIKK